MSDLQFGATVDMLENTMDGAGSMHQMLANKIANVIRRISGAQSRF